MSSQEAPTTQRPIWHSLAAEDCLTLIGTRWSGLTDAEAADRLRRLGPNRLPTTPPAGFGLLFLQQFRSPLIYLLLGAALVSLAVGELVDAGFIAAVLTLNALIGAAQERRAESSMEALQTLIRHEARVRRAGAVTSLDASEVVFGDIVEFETGMAVPADMRLLSDWGLRVNEATLTGESLPVSKSANCLAAPAASTADRLNMVYAGTVVAEGRGIGLVVATGRETALGRIAAALRGAAHEPPPLIRRLERLARQVAVGAVLLIVVLGALLTVQGHEPLQILLLAAALAVSAIPEGLPIAVTVALASATRRMAGRSVIVRSLPAVEGLGACTLIATDKTGTLTQNRLSVEQLVFGDGSQVEHRNWARERRDPRLASAAAAASICNEAASGPDGAIVGDSVDIALLRFAAEAGEDPGSRASLDWILPYEPARRFSAAAARNGDSVSLYVKGAPETVLEMCAPQHASAIQAAEELARDGYRVIALARRGLQAGEMPDEAMHDLDLLGFVGLIDPLRPEVPDAVARCMEAGIGVRMITGDHPTTAVAVARQAGLAVAENEVVTGATLAALEGLPEERSVRIVEGRVFARIEPAQKLMIVQELAQAGEIVAVTGDGVNDAPALQAAHVGVAMGRSGTDVARGASDLVLADDNFASIVAGVEEGRITYANVRKIVIFLLATGVAEIFMFLGAILTGLPMPLTAVQLLWCNVVTNGAQDVMLGFGRGEGDELKRPPRKPDAPILDQSALCLMIPPALVMTLAALLMMDRVIDAGGTVEEGRNAVLLLTVLFQNAFVLVMRSERRPFWRESIASNPWLLLGVGAALSLHIAAMHLPPLRAVLGTSPVNSSVVMLCLLAMIAVVLVAEISKGAVKVRGSRAPR